MYQYQNFRSGTSLIPKVIKLTIALTLIFTLFSIISNALFTQVLGLPSPQYLLSLSTWGIHKLFIWQFVTYLFIQPLAEAGISFGLLLRIFFDLYLLWVVGTSIVQLKGRNHFIALFYGSGAFIGLVAYLSLLFLGSPAPFAGATSAIFSLLIGWVFLFPTASIMLFLMIPMRAKWLVFGLIGVNLFLDFSNGNFFGFFVTASSLFYGYFYSVLVWEMLSPFPRLHNLEKQLIHLKRKWKNRLTSSQEDADGKIFDIKTGRAVFQDAEFMDRCLEKIALHGKGSLTWREKWKMYRLSKKQGRA